LHIFLQDVQPQTGVDKFELLLTEVINTTHMAVRQKEILSFGVMYVMLIRFETRDLYLQ